jgi:hypothetical protein
MTMNLHSELVSSRELRRASRLEFRRRAWCEHRDFTLYPAIMNLSRGGLFLQASTPLAVGERLKVTLLQGEPGIVVDIEIVWVKRRGPGAGFGCRIVGFVEGADQYGALLDQLRRGIFERGMRESRDCSWSVLSR